MAEYHYIQSEPGLWTVGTGTPKKDWEPESDHDTREAAAERVAFLNGGSALPKEAIANIQQIRGLVHENNVMRKALEEIAFGSFGKSVAVKNIARKALEEANKLNS
jgi:GH24 family phage-related lysozyme (muramidase)